MLGVTGVGSGVVNFGLAHRLCCLCSLAGLTDNLYDFPITNGELELLLSF